MKKDQNFQDFQILQNFQNNDNRIIVWTSKLWVSPQYRLAPYYAYAQKETAPCYAQVSTDCYGYFKILTSEIEIKVETEVKIKARS